MTTEVDIKQFEFPDSNVLLVAWGSNELTLFLLIEISEGSFIWKHLLFVYKLIINIWLGRRLRLIA